MINTKATDANGFKRIHTDEKTMQTDFNRFTRMKSFIRLHPQQSV